jgi:predicted homoserine dehydrogenase-like protein
MSLFKKLQAREAEGNPLRIGVIGAGKFGTMFLAQAAKLPGVHIVGVADLSVESARSNLLLCGWSEESFATTSLDAAAD